MATISISSPMTAAPTTAVAPRTASADDVRGWIDRAIDDVKAAPSAPPRAGRALAYVSVAMQDALTAARSGLVPVDEPTLLAQVVPAVWRGVYGRDLGAGDAGPADAATGAGEIGKAVVERTLARAAADGAASELPTSPVGDPADPGQWQPTAPNFGTYLVPHWGNVKTFVARPEQLVATPPPAWTSPEFDAQRASFLKQQQSLTPGKQAVARRWAGDPGTPTPGGLWMQRAARLTKEHGLDALETARTLASTGKAVHDGFVASWAAKRQHMLARPQNWINHEIDPTWRPMLETPPFPGYTSGHATVSGAASELLARQFPGKRESLRHDAAEAARSRVYGGIHWQLDGAGGLEVGRRIGAAVADAAGLPPRRS